MGMHRSTYRLTEDIREKVAPIYIYDEKEKKPVLLGLNDDDTYLGLVNATFAIAAGLTGDQLLCQEQDPQHVNANILACRSDNKDSAKIKALVKVLTTEETATFITGQFKGTIIPYFKSLV